MKHIVQRSITQRGWNGEEGCTNCAMRCLCNSTQPELTTKAAQSNRAELNWAKLQYLHDEILPQLHLGATPHGCKFNTPRFDQEDSPVQCVVWLEDHWAEWHWVEICTNCAMCLNCNSAIPRGLNWLHLGAILLQFDPPRFDHHDQGHEVGWDDDWIFQNIYCTILHWVEVQQLFWNHDIQLDYKHSSFWPVIVKQLILFLLILTNNPTDGNMMSPCNGKHSFLKQT